MMNYLVTIIKLIIMSLFAVLVVALVIVSGMYVLAILCVIPLILAVAWLLDIKFTVTAGGKQTGYYKRSTGFVPNKIIGE